jgi:hypothetical protein
MERLRVRIVSPAEAERGVAELWLGTTLFAFTRIVDGDLVLRVLGSGDDAPVAVNVADLVAALRDVTDQLKHYARRPPD